MRLKSALVTIAAVLAWTPTPDAEVLRAAFPLLSSSSQEPSQGGPSETAPAQPASPLPGAISSYQGLIVHSIRFRGRGPAEKDHLLQSLPQKIGMPLDRDLIRESVQKLFASGLFADIQVEAERTLGNDVDLLYITSPNFFVGDVRVEGAADRPTNNQIVNASKFQLGELFTAEKMDRALKSIQRLMQENGYYRSTVSHQETSDAETQQVTILFLVKPGPIAHIGRVAVNGNPGYSQGQIQDIAGMDPGDRVSADRVTRALQRVRKKYQKQNRLLAQVSIDHAYRAEANVVDYTFQIDPGPTVSIGVEGFKIRHSVLKRNVPVYEEGALDDDLLNEGRRNLLDYMQTRGYFDAKVGIKKQSESASRELRVLYVIDPGARHKLVKITINVNGKPYFDEELLRSHMQVQPTSSRFAQGHFSKSLLNSDVRNLQNLYEANGFQNVQIKSRVEDDYQGDEAHLAVVVDIDEGPQTLVGSLHVVGNNTFRQDQFPEINIAAGQPYSESKIAEDRDILLNYYFNHGFPNATFEASTKPVEGDPNRVDVTFTIKEGEQFFVNRVLVSGLNFTRPYIAERELKVVPETPLSQQDMLDTQRGLYDLGIFNQVDTAVQNPEGAEPNKNVLVDVHEAKRYTFDYGGGIEFQTGQPGVGSNRPQGNTGVSPRVSFAVTRLNFRGRDETLTFRTNLGSLQQRVLASFEAPHWLSRKLRLSITGFYDNTLDVTTFTSQRLEGAVQIEQTFDGVRKVNTLIYRFTYRRVKATNIVVTSNEIPVLSQPTRVGMPGFTYIRDKRDNPVETTRGNYTTIDGGAAYSYFGSEADFGRLLVQNSTYQPFGKNPSRERKYVFARSTRIGLESPFGDTVIVSPGESLANPLLTPIPLPERFLSGGGNSHRGFGLNQAGPRDPTTGFPLGGSALFVNNLELRFPPVTLPYVQDNLSFAVFHDAGNVFTAGHDMLRSFSHWRQSHPSLCMNQSTRNQCDYDYISQAIGLGVRYRTPIGPIRFDFGYNLNPPVFPSFVLNSHGQPTTTFAPQRASHFNVYFSIGQTF